VSVEFWNYRTMNVEGEIKPTRSAFSSGPKTARRSPKLFLTHSSSCRGIADAFRDHGDSLTPQCVLEPIGNKARFDLS